MHIQVKEHQRPPVKFNATNHSLIHLKQPLKDKDLQGCKKKGTLIRKRLTNTQDS
jgi:hypothetical protein